MTIFLAKNHRRDMAFNGPMRSGLVIDSRALLAKGYAEQQAEISTRIDIAHPGEWYTPAQQGARQPHEDRRRHKARQHHHPRLFHRPHP